MAGLTFPTRPPHSGRTSVGTPTRADHCVCIGPWPDGDECVRCGHYTRVTIDRTWQTRAIVIATKRSLVAA